MIHIFYLLSILPILFEISNVLHTRRYYSFSTAFKAKLKSNADWDWEDLNKTEQAFSALTIGYILWLFVGMFTSQWLIFLFIFLISYIPKKHIIVYFIDSLVSAIALLFIVLNAYHFKIDMWQLLLDQFKS